MEPVIPDPKNIKSFRSAAELEKWLSTHHDRANELWLRVYKTKSGRPTVTIAEALDVMLCWGWIDGLRKAYDESSFLQRYSPRKSKSIWSHINRENVARLTAAGRMTPHGQKHIDAAKADGRWDAAYAPMRSASRDTIPQDLRTAIDANARARKTFQLLNRQNLFSLTFRTNNMKTPAGRARKIEALVAMLAKGETIVPQRLDKKVVAKRAGSKKSHGVRRQPKAGA
jgi:uncharacterized protein YdeI (YjbR/CyaY-like superfamily)